MFVLGVDPVRVDAGLSTYSVSRTRAWSDQHAELPCLITGAAIWYNSLVSCEGGCARRRGGTCGER